MMRSTHSRLSNAEQPYPAFAHRAQSTSTSATSSTATPTHAHTRTAGRPVPPAIAYSFARVLAHRIEVLPILAEEPALYRAPMVVIIQPRRVEAQLGQERRGQVTRQDGEGRACRTGKLGSWG